MFQGQFQVTIIGRAIANKASVSQDKINYINLERGKKGVGGGPG